MSLYYVIHVFLRSNCSETEAGPVTRDIVNIEEVKQFVQLLNKFWLLLKEVVGELAFFCACMSLFVL